MSERGYIQTLEDRKRLLVDAARMVAGKSYENPYLSGEDRSALLRYSVYGERTEYVDEFILVNKQRILEAAFPVHLWSSAAWINDLVTNPLPERILDYLRGGGHFVGVDNYDLKFKAAVLIALNSERKAIERINP